MADAFNTQTIERLSRQLQEPSWLRELRHRALATHQQLPWPHSSDEIWRRTDVKLLDPQQGFQMATPDGPSRIDLDSRELKAFVQPLGDESLWVRANGSWLKTPQSPISPIEEMAHVTHQDAKDIQQIIEADGLTDAEKKLTSLNLAFHHDDLYLSVPKNTAIRTPLHSVRIFSVGAQQAIFPLTVIVVRAGSSVTLIDEYISFSTPPEAKTPSATKSEPHLIHGRIELVLEEGADVRYVRLQRWAPCAREFLLQRATLARGATLTMTTVNLGASLSKTHVVARLMGERATSSLYGFVFGQQGQHIDQHTLQDHQAPHTRSNLQFKAALQDQSRMIYTGLIRIAPQAQQTQAYQANHNLLLSEKTQAETIPMLEILADDVQCKHGVSVGPIDEEQLFYLMSRGLPRELAERLVVMGFIEPIMQQVPFEPLQARLRQEIEGSLHGEEWRG